MKLTELIVLQMHLLQKMTVSKWMTVCGVSRKQKVTIAYGLKYNKYMDNLIYIAELLLQYFQYMLKLVHQSFKKISKNWLMFTNSS